MELTEKKLDYQQLILSILSVAWHRKVWLCLPILIGGLVSVYFIKTLPKIYKSSTFIIVEGQKIPQNIVKSAVTGTAQDRLSTIKQQILSRSFLNRIIEKFDLYGSDDPSKAITNGAKLNRIRKNIVVSTRGRRRLESFTISYQGEGPEVVMHVTNELASLVMEENLKIREQAVEGALEFLNLELQSLKEELERQELGIVKYKRTHLGELPSQLDTNLRALDRFQSNLESVELSKKATQDRILSLERMLLQKKKRQVAQAEFNVQSGVSGEVVLGRPPSLLEQRLASRQEELADLLTEYSEDYPDVAILRRNVSLLENQVARLKKNQVVSSVGESRPDIFDGSEVIFGLKRQVGRALEELDYIVKKEQKIHEKIKLYERRVENTPKRAQEMVIMTRDYENISANYQILLNKKLSATISENLEKRQKGEQFRIIDSANFPEEPIKPNRLILALMGIFGGLGLGVALVFCREQLDNSIRNPEEVERLTSVLVLAEIPDFSEVRTTNKKVVNLEKFADRKNRLRHKGING